VVWCSVNIANLSSGAIATTIVVLSGATVQVRRVVSALKLEIAFPVSKFQTFKVRSLATETAFEPSGKTEKLV
jgi:hypothetical protein